MATQVGMIQQNFNGVVGDSLRAESKRFTHRRYQKLTLCEKGPVEVMQRMKIAHSFLRFTLSF